MIELTAAFMLQVKMSAHSSKDGGQPTGPHIRLPFKDISRTVFINFRLDEVFINSNTRSS